MVVMVVVVVVVVVWKGFRVLAVVIRRAVRVKHLEGSAAISFFYLTFDYT